jgi:integrase
VTMQELCARWLQGLEARVALGKLKPASLATYRGYVRAHIIPNLGTVNLEDVRRNSCMKEFAENIAASKLHAKSGLNPESARKVVSVVKAILESYRNDEGECLLDLSKWNTDFIFESLENSGQLNQPTVSARHLNAVLSDVTMSARNRVFITLAAATGLRIGEMLALRMGPSPASSWEGGVIHVRESIWNGRSQTPKTAAAIREVDLPSVVQGMLEAYSHKLEPGDFIFSSNRGNPLDPSYVNKHILKPAWIPGAHSLRRFRVSHLAAVGCNVAILKFWIGHGPENISDIYKKMSEKTELRRAEAERCGTGLDIQLRTIARDGMNITIKEQAA